MAAQHQGRHDIVQDDEINGAESKCVTYEDRHRPITIWRRYTGEKKCTFTPDRAISYGWYDWLRLGQGATDRQCLLRSPAAVAYGDRSLRVVALSRTIGEYGGQEPS